MSNPHDRIPALDGLRGLAVIVVILSRYQIYPLAPDSWFERLWVGLVSLGYAGVDLFFVLSGFLITSILIRHRNSERRFSSFYARRALRILPLYYALCFIVMVVMPAIGRGPEGGEPIFNILFLQNFKGLFHSPEHAFLGPTWSLAIEEQFYLVWPLLIWFLGPARAFYAIAAAVAATVLCRAGLYLSGFPVEKIYLWTITRLDGIGLGSILAIAWAEQDRYAQVLQFLRRQLAPSAMALMAIVVISALLPRASFLAFEPGMMLAGFLLVALVCTGMVLAALEKPSFAARFSVAPLRSCGRYSYAMYLIHTPVIITLGEVVRFRPLNIGIALVTTYVLAALSWSLFESRILALGRFFPYDAPRDRKSVLARETA
jgi:peptidoglycan/LPS O-acetylase OafA/YrhL